MLEAVGMLSKEGIKIGYRIQHDGKVYEATRTADERFECEGFIGTLKQVKQKIYDGCLDHFADLTWGVEARTTTRCPDVMENHQDKESFQSTWGCVHPCAMMILFCTKLDHPEVLRTLDSYGWLLPNGVPNIEEARKSMSRDGEQDGGSKRTTIEEDR